MVFFAPLLLCDAKEVSFTHHSTKNLENTGREALSAWSLNKIHIHWWESEFF